MAIVKRDPYALYCEDASLTKQAFKEEVDINKIIDRARAGQDISHVNERVAKYGDVSGIPDYRSALDQVQRANGMFMEMDAVVRERFGNDPAKMVDFLHDPRNREEAIKLGLVVEKPITPVPPVESQDRGLGVDASSGAKVGEPKAKTK